MTEHSFRDLGFGWRGHRAALWWLGLLYRRPQKLRAALEELSRGRQFLAGGWLVTHAVPWAFLLAFVGRVVVFDFLGAPLESGLDPTLGDHAQWALVPIALGLAGGLFGGLAGGITGGLFGGLAVGLAGGIVFGLALGIVFGVVRRFVVGLPAGLAYGLSGGLVVGLGEGLAVGLAGGLAGMVSLVRAYYLPAHLLFIGPRPRPRLYRFHPVAWDDLCGVPFPGLDRLLVSRAELEPAAGEEEIERLIDSYPSQRGPALKAKTVLTVRRAADAALASVDEALAGLPEGEKGYLARTRDVRRQVAEIAAQQRRLDAIDRPFLREPNARALVKEIEVFRSRVAGLKPPLGEELRTAAARWLEAARRQHEAARKVVEREPTAQVFRAGDPVRRDAEAFVHRYGVTGELERQATLATGCPGIVLYGRRRMGKSTVLGNLDGFLPSELEVVSLSMQSARAHASLPQLLATIAESLEEAIPALAAPRPGDLVTFEDLLGAADEELERRGRRLLIGLDEYEYLDRKIGEGVFPEDLLGSLRESIQRHRHLVWLFAGSHEITELTHAPWTSYLVSVRTVEVPPFTPEETRLLLTEPLRHSRLFRDAESRPSFAPGFWGEGGIERVHAEVGGWPHLVQLLAESLVDRVNDAGASEVTPELFEEALDRAVMAGHNVLYELLRGECQLDGEWQYLARFAANEELPPPEDPEVAARLRHRLLVLADGDRWRLRAPLMRRWLRQHV